MHGPPGSRGFFVGTLHADYLLRQWQDHQHQSHYENLRRRGLQTSLRQVIPKCVRPPSPRFTFYIHPLTRTDDQAFKGKKAP